MNSKNRQGERRLRRRHAVEDVHGNVLFSYECRVLNLSEDGIALQTATPLRPGRSYTVRLEHEGHSVPLTGTVAWCRLQANQRNQSGELVPVYSAGLDVKDGLREAENEMRELLATHGVVQLEQPLAGHLIRRGPDEDDSPVAFVVDRISQSTASLAAEATPEPGDLLELRLEAGGPPIRLTGRVTRTKPPASTAGTEPTSIDVEILPPAPGDRERLKRLIQDELGEG